MSQQLILYQSILVSDIEISKYDLLGSIISYLEKWEKGEGEGGEKYSISDLDGKHSMLKAISNSEKKKYSTAFFKG